MNIDTSTTQQALWTLLIDDWIDKLMAREVETAKQLMSQYLESKPRMERKQLSNLGAVAAETNAVPVVEDWVRYQMGRDDRARSWRAGNPVFGDAVLKHLGELKTEAKRLVEEAKQVKGVSTPTSESAEVDRVWILLTRRFAALLEHSYVYYKGTGSGGQP